MAALTDAMKWYNVGGLTAARLKYFFKVEFYISKYNMPNKAIYDCIRTIELPKYSIDSEVVNSWNVRQVVPTKINFEPISITFNDTVDNRFQNFIVRYMDIVSNSFQKLDRSVRTGLDGFGLNSLKTDADSVIDKIVIYRFYGADSDRENFENAAICTLWRPKIIDVQHDTLDYSSSDAVTWQISLRYESVTYYDKESQNKTTGPASQDPAPASTPVEMINLPTTRQWNWSTGSLEDNTPGSDLPPAA